jgi:hypothetical protein
MDWKYSKENPCPTCYSWIPKDSPCNHEKYQCPECGRKQCLLHWRYPMKSKKEAIHFLKSAQVQTNKECLIRSVYNKAGKVKWKIFTSEEDYESYIRTGKHKR